MKPIAAFLGVVLSLSSLCGCAHIAGHHTPDRNIQLESFDYAWSRPETYYDPEMNGLDWNAIREEFRPRATSATTNKEVADLIEEMMERIGESHFQIIPQFHYETESSTKDGPDSLENPNLSGTDDAPSTEDSNFRGTLGLKIHLIGKDVVIREVDPGSTAHEKGIRVGWRITAVDEIEILTLLEELGGALETERDLEFYGSRYVQGLLEPAAATRWLWASSMRPTPPISSASTPHPWTGISSPTIPFSPRGSRASTRGCLRTPPLATSASMSGLLRLWSVSPRPFATLKRPGSPMASLWIFEAIPEGLPPCPWESRATLWRKRDTALAS